MKDQDGTPLKEGDTVELRLIARKPLKFKIESFKNTLHGYLACGEYGCIAVNLLIKVDDEH